MRPLLGATAITVALVALWTILLPLIAEPVTTQVAATSPAVSRVLMFCRSDKGLGQTCMAALAKSLLYDARSDMAIRTGAGRCRAEQRVLVNLARRD
jgi:hypothetical protein